MDNQEKHIPQQLKISIDKIVQKEGYISYKIINRPLPSSGVNFMANLYAVDIEGKTPQGNKEINIFIKNKIENSQFTVVDIEKSYSTEVLFYNEISKLYDDLQNMANIPSAERYAMVKSYDTANPNAVILENLDKKGFKTMHRTEVAPLQLAQLSIQQLARFHGLSWVLEKQHPEFYSKKIKVLKTKYVFNKDYDRMISNMGMYIDKCFDEDKRFKLEKFRPHIVPTLKNYFGNSKNKCCLCHGDFWSSNILYKKDNDNITEVVAVDYQLMYYGNPVMDFIFFIFIISDQEFRRKHLDDLKDLYHESLAKFLKYFDMEVESVYPRQEFETEYKKKLDFGLIMNLMLMPVLFTDDDDVPDLNKEDVGTVIVKPSPKMDERIRGLVDDFEKWGRL